MVVVSAASVELPLVFGGGQPVFAPRIAGKGGVIEIGSECRGFGLPEIVGDNAAGIQGSGRSTSLIGSSGLLLIGRSECRVTIEVDAYNYSRGYSSLGDGRGAGFAQNSRYLL